MAQKKYNIRSGFCLFLLAVSSHFVSAQYSSKTDSVIESILGHKLNFDDGGQGASLMKDGKYSEANDFFSSELNKNDLNREAYFNRGVARWQLNETEEACHDWSAVLALGDTATFLLLDSKCGGSMTLGGDTLSSKQYRKIFAQPKKESNSAAADVKVQNIADVMPEYPGGMEGLYKYLSTNTKYPSAAMQSKTQGRVYVSFVINRKGKVLYPYVVRGIGHGCDQEAVRAIKKMPTWKPGTQKGKPVLVRYVIPVHFKQN
jgi:TonB family protein